MSRSQAILMKINTNVKKCRDLLGEDESGRKKVHRPGLMVDRLKANMRHSIQKVMNSLMQEGRARIREKKARMKELLERAEKLKKEASGEISTMEELKEVKNKIKEMEIEIANCERIQIKLK